MRAQRARRHLDRVALFTQWRTTNRRRRRARGRRAAAAARGAAGEEQREAAAVEVGELPQHQQQVGSRLRRPVAEGEPTLERFGRERAAQPPRTSVRTRPPSAAASAGGCADRKPSVAAIAAAR